MPNYRSKAEERFANALAEKGIRFEYEPEKWDYAKKLVNSFCGECDHPKVYQRKKYTPDFYFPDYGFYIELKGRLTSRDRTKYIAVKRSNPRKDLRFVCLADNKISKSSATRYSDWLREQAMVFHVGKDIPDHWFGPAGKKPTRTRSKAGQRKEST
ncbi:MAG: hypothetical protein E6Q97_36580 [Desulfurellales bacterium]|nr:MAG: hypothetical protein E6Q97_36580 [Desulfurellales bacterium]